MEPQKKQQAKAKKTNSTAVKNAALVTVIGTGLYWLFNRAHVIIDAVNEEEKTVKYKAVIGIREISGEASILSPVDQKHVIGNKTLTVNSIYFKSVEFKITHNRTGKVLHHAIVYFTTPPMPLLDEIGCQRGILNCDNIKLT